MTMDASSSAAKQPNILFIMTDQMCAPILPFYDPKSSIKMPHLSRLAKESVVFDSAYCNSPLCAPSRLVLMSGQLPHKIGAYDNAADFVSNIPTFAHYLRRLGYHTCLSGKMHFVGADQLHGYEERLTSDIYPADYGWTVNWDLGEVRQDWYHNMSSVLDAGSCVRTNQIDFDEEVMYNAQKYLYDHARRSMSQNRMQPFFLTVSLTHPHDPYTTLKQFWDMYEDEQIPLPTIKIEQEDQDPHSIRLMKVIDIWDNPMSEEAIRRARRAYFGNCSYVDANVGKLLQVLKECDLVDDTIIIFSGDHGDFLGERGLWYKMSFLEPSARVPFLVYAPKYFSPRRVTESVSTIDLLPTLVQLAGGQLQPDLEMDGRTLLPHLTGAENKHDEVIGEYMAEGTLAPLMMIRRGAYKFIYCPIDPPQLFNIQNDPHELVNLAQSSSLEHVQLLARFLKEIEQRWNMSSITAQVLQSQRRRRFTDLALRIGQWKSWDHQPFRDASKQYIRSVAANLDDLEYLARFPRTAEVPPSVAKQAAGS
ncbi:unnamed protein product [Rotaria magnacalcarata]|uniref:Choline-sulfatase n=2 Tax=Rotaria magnacalcarata TaxID=392030 RepID=A0A816TBM7_9BILA|nr:unnamed protein product [Rotaria magnacalcarata]